MALQIRRGTDAEWEANNYNIVAGEPAIATDTGRFFVGTGNGTFSEMATKADLEEVGLSDDVKAALLQLAEKVAYIDDDGQVYYDALYAALHPESTRPLYPLENGSHTFSDNNARSLIVSGGNHFKYANTNALTSGTGAYVNLSEVSANGTSTSSTNLPTSETGTVWFTIPSGASYTATVSNITISNLNTTNYNITFYDGSGNIINFGDRNVNTDITKTGVAAADIQVYGIGLYARNSYSLVEADISLEVDGVRFI